MPRRPVLPPVPDGGAVPPARPLTSCEATVARRRAAIQFDRGPKRRKRLGLDPIGPRRQGVAQRPNAQAEKTRRKSRPFAADSQSGEGRNRTGDPATVLFRLSTTSPSVWPATTNPPVLVASL